MRNVTVLGLMLAALATVCQAWEFSADAIVTADGRTIKSKIYMKDTKFRAEMPEMGGYTIVNGDAKTACMVMPQQKMYMEMKADQINTQMPKEKMPGEISRKKVGTESIDGRSCDKTEVTCKNGDQTTVSLLWIAKDLTFPVKMADPNGKWIVEYKNIKTGNISDDLFKIPSGFTKMDMPGMQGNPFAGQEGNPYGGVKGQKESQRESQNSGSLNR